MKVRLHIDRLIFDGVSMTPAQRTALVGATRMELERLLSAPSFSGAPMGLTTGFAAPVVDAGSLRQPTSPLDPAAFGTELARTLVTGLRRRDE
jgi:hypothetical protein